MIFTDLAYLEVGRLMSYFMLCMTIGIAIFRCCRCFYTYINTGKFGSYKDTWLTQTVEEGKFFSPCLFTGGHPMFIIDIIILAILSVAAIAFWGLYVVLGLIILLAKVMRKRIGARQEFIARLEGTHEK